MGKYVHPDVLDSAVGYFETHCDKMTMCTAEPTSYTEANVSFAVAEVTLDGDDFAVSDGEVGGRKVTVSAQSNVEVFAAGTATHLALLDTVNSRLLLVTTISSKMMAAGDYANVSSFDFEIGEPT